MSKTRGAVLALLGLVGASVFLLSCGTSSSRLAGVLYLLSQGASNIGSYAVDLSNGKLSLINANAPTDTQPSAIILDPAGSTAFVLNIGSNSVTSYTVNGDGSLAESSDKTAVQVANSVTMARDDSGKLLFVVSQGTIPPPPNCGIAPTNGCPGISVFSMQTGSTTLTPVAGSPFLVGRVPSAVMPSVTATLPNPANPGANLSGPLVYVTNDRDLMGSNDNTVSEFIFDTASNALVELPGSPYTTGTVPSAVLAVKTAPAGGTGGLFVYVANSGSGPGADSVSVFQVCTVQNGSCTAQDVADATMVPGPVPISVGLTPVAMVDDPTGNFLYVANFGSSQVYAFRINQTTGTLSALTPATVNTGFNPVALAMHSSGKFLYVSNNGASSVSGFNVDTTSGALSNATLVTSSAQPTGMAVK